uniref:Tubulin-specific chaperone D n=1 Tax=Globodera pallida TaxID=36090 RepID=A0A183BMW5_GLOPA
MIDTAYGTINNDSDGNEYVEIDGKKYFGIVLHEQQLMGGRVPLNYADFLRQFGMILPLSFPDRLNTYALDCNNYFRSQSARIRQNAAMLIGFMLTALTPELRGTLSKDLIFSGLEQLLRDPDEDVRVQTVSAIALLYAFA